MTIYIYPSRQLGHASCSERVVERFVPLIISTRVYVPLRKQEKEAFSSLVVASWDVVSPTAHDLARRHAHAFSRAVPPTVAIKGDITLTEAAAAADATILPFCFEELQKSNS